jgi:hypothetical protein
VKSVGRFYLKPGAPQQFTLRVSPTSPDVCILP